jgi:glutaredoxin 3
MLIEIYSKPNCQYCLYARNLLIALNREFVQYKLDEDFSRDELIQKFPEAKTFPVVVIDGNYVGGYTQLKELLT